MPRMGIGSGRSGGASRAFLTLGAYPRGMSLFRRSKTSRSTGGRLADAAREAASVPAVDFLIVGCMKCGTTSLRRVLGAHPQVHMPERELHFFGNHERYLSVWKDGRIDADALEEAYGRHYRTERPVLGGKTPNYIVSSLTVERIHRFHPDLKLVVMVRDPIERAESHWNHILRQVQSGKVPAHAAEATFAATLERDRLEIERAYRPDAEIRHTNVLFRGLYAQQIRRLGHFFAADRVHVGVMDDMKADADAFYAALFTFLGIDDVAAAVAESRAQPAEGARGERVRLSDAEKTELAAYYAESVRDLEALLGRKLPGWLV